MQTKVVKKNIRLLLFPLAIGLMCSSMVLLFLHLKTIFELGQNHTLLKQSIEIITILVTNNHLKLMAIIGFYLILFCITATMYHKEFKIVDHIDQEHQDFSKFKLIVDHSSNAFFISSADNIINTVILKDLK